MKRLLQFFVVLLAIHLMIPPVKAMEWKQGDSVVITKEHTVGSTLMIGGNTIVVDGTVHGDVFCAGKTVTISGTVDGDVLCAAQELTISGTILGDIRSVAQSLTVTGRVDGNATLIAQSTSVATSATASGEVLVAAQSLKINGVVGAVTGVSNELDISGEIHGDATVYASVLRVGNNARIFGSLRYTSENEAVIADGAIVSGIVSHVTPDTKKNSQEPLTSTVPHRSTWPSNALTSVIFYMLLSLLANALFTKKIQQVAHTIEHRWMISMGIGLLSCIALPFITLFLLVTIIGILLIPIPIFAVVVATGFGRIVAAQVFGKSILEGFKVKQSNNPYLQSLVGIPILFCMFKAPFVGGLFTFISIILGLGSFILSFQHTGKKMK